MANPSSVGVGDNNPAILLTSTTAASVTLDPNKVYLLQHNGMDDEGNDIGDAIMLATGSATAALTAGAGQATLLDEKQLYIGPGVTTLKFDAKANDPTFSVIPLQNTFGRW